ncbi:MAG: hypothetical protein PHD76_07630 [Methylacidiphilales bacterium]|nr:hypothetical protein [Candidatus Methylacidiphilales bacterium]
MIKCKKQIDLLARHVAHEVLSNAQKEAKALQAYICAVYRPDKNMEPEQFATATRIKVDDHYFLVTAAHVLDDNDDGNTLYIQGHVSGKLEELVGDSFRSSKVIGSRKQDHTDIGVVKINGTLLDNIGRDYFMSVEMLDPNDTGTSGGIYLAMGFPASKNRLTYNAGGKIKCRGMLYTANILPKEKIDQLKLGNSAHLLIGFDKKNTHTKDGVRIVPPDPTGLSGGPLWRYSPYDDSPVKSRCVGIMIEWRQEVKGLLALRVPVLIAGIAHEYPQLKQYLPQTITVRVNIA